MNEIEKNALLLQREQARIGNQAALMKSLLDRGFVDQTEQVLFAMTRNVNSGLMNQRLDELDEEAIRLASLGEKMKPNNAVLRACVADFEAAMRKNETLMQSALPGVQQHAVVAADTINYRMTFGNIPRAGLQKIGIGWNTPDPDAVLGLLDYTSKPEFAKIIDSFAPNAASTVRQIAINGFVNGRGPGSVAEDIALAIRSIPEAWATNFMRTAQLTTYRDATAIQQAANADIITRVIRVAALDERTCPACVALHGTEIKIGDRVFDHHMGRCTSITEVIGLPRNIPSGTTWFEAQSSDTQQKILGGPAYRAYVAGDVRLEDFPKSYNNDLFGEMVGAASLRGLLGDAAKKYYSNAS